MNKDEAWELIDSALDHSYSEKDVIEIKEALAQPAITQNYLEKDNSQPAQEPVAVYGYCPTCGAKGVSRERHPDGSDICTSGHTYKSKDALATPQQRPWVDLTDDDYKELHLQMGTIYYYQEYGQMVEAKSKELNK